MTLLEWLCRSPQAAHIGPVHMGTSGWQPEAITGLQWQENLVQKAIPMGPDFPLGVILLHHSGHSGHLDSWREWSTTASPTKATLCTRMATSSVGMLRDRAFACLQVLLPGAVSDWMTKELSFSGCLTRPRGCL